MSADPFVTVARSQGRGRSTDAAGQDGLTAFTAFTVAEI
jgi:hypothetical protein